MNMQNRLPRIFTWVLILFVLSELALIGTAWLSYCPPTAAIRFAFSGEWFKEKFPYGSAGLALDQPTIGKFFLWTSVMFFLACTLILLLQTIMDARRQVARRFVKTGVTILVLLMLIELLAPTFFVLQYILSMGITTRRLLGLCLCCAFWILLPCIPFWTGQINPTPMKWIKSLIIWALACALAVPTYYLILMVHPSSWRSWNTLCATFAIGWLAMVFQTSCGIWLNARKRRYFMTQ